MNSLKKEKVARVAKMFSLLLNKKSRGLECRASSKIRMCREFKVANRLNYFLLCFMLNINMMYYNLRKSSVDGDRLRVFKMIQELKSKLKPRTLLKKRLWHRCFPVNFEKFLRTPFFTEHLRWLFMNLYWKLRGRNIFQRS